MLPHNQKKDSKKLSKKNKQNNMIEDNSGQSF